MRDDGSFCLMLWPDISRVTSDVINGMSVTQSGRGWAHSYHWGGRGRKREKEKKLRYTLMFSVALETAQPSYDHEGDRGCGDGGKGVLQHPKHAQPYTW